MRLRIAVIGYDVYRTLKACEYIATEADSVAVARKHMGCYVMGDGTTYMPIFNEQNLRGMYFDQMIVVDDERYNVFRVKNDIIQQCSMRLYPDSCIPDNIKIQTLTW